MDGKRFDELSKVLPGSRRTVLTSGAALAFAGMVSALSTGTARARKHRLKPAYTCPPPSEIKLTPTDGTRLAQSFTATRSGTLRQIKIGIAKNDPGGDYTVQVVKMAGTVPSNTAIDVIAAVVVPEGQVNTGETTLVASFGPTRLTQGTQYAVVVTRPAKLVVASHAGGEDCEGEAFVATSTGDFDQTLEPRDLIVTVLVA